MEEDSDLLQVRIASLEQKLASVKIRTNELLPDIKSTRPPNALFSSRVPELLEEQTVEPNVATLKAQLQQQERAHTVIQTKWKSELESVKKQFENDLSTKDSEISRLEATVTSLNSELLKAKSKQNLVNELKTTVENLQAERDSANRKAKAIEGEAKQLTKLLQEVYDELQGIKANALAVENSLRLKTSESESRAQAAEFRLSELESLLQAAESRQVAEKRRIEAIVQAQARLEDEVKHVIHSNQDLKTQLDQERKRYSSLQHIHSRELAELKASISRKLPYITEISEVKRQYKNIHDELEALKAERPEPSKSIEHKLTQLQMERNELESTLQHFPVHAKTQAVRLRKAEVEEDLGIIESNISTLKHKLRSLRASAS